jgi:hypothetical protein
MIQIKSLTDNEKKELSDKLAMLNLNDRDDVIFNFEADMKKLVKGIDMRKILRKDKKYIANLKNYINGMVRNIYLKDIINVGKKKTKRFVTSYIEAPNAG